MAPRPLTKRQREIYDFLGTEIRARGYAPSLEEVGTRFGLSSLATVHKHLENLREKGWITRRFGHSRGIDLVVVNLNTCPHCGQTLLVAGLAHD